MTDAPGQDHDRMQFLACRNVTRSWAGHKTKVMHFKFKGNKCTFVSGQFTVLQVVAPTPTGNRHPPLQRLRQIQSQYPVHRLQSPSHPVHSHLRTPSFRPQVRVVVLLRLPAQWLPLLLQPIASATQATESTSYSGAGHSSTR